MLPNILIALAIVGAIGLVCGVLLALAAYFLHVEENETVKKIRDCLPSVNCGACGYAGCDEYAAAVAINGEKINLCIPGADPVSAEIAKILGTEAVDTIEMIATIHCNGRCEATSQLADYDGIKSCAAAAMVYGGPNSCKFGCLGCGDCAAVCPSDAICVKDGIAYVNGSKCLGCGLCAKTCPKGIIELIPAISKVSVLCSNTEKGAVARKKCKNACIGCKKCESACPEKAITVENNVAKIDQNKCSRCGICSECCPVNCIQLIGEVSIAR